MISLPRLLRSISCLLIAAPLLTGDLALSQSTRSAAAIQFVPPLPPLQGRPIGSRRGGASRGDCPVRERQLTALVPGAIEPADREPAIESVWGLTTAERPTFWFYLPYALTDNRPGEFVLLDDENNYVYRAAIVRPDVAEGIIGISLPATVAPLALDRTYRWAFLVYCETDDPIFTQGNIQRVTLPAALASQLEVSAPVERAAIYAQNGIWYDALTTLAELHRAEPNNAAIAADWQSLMQSIGLDEMADQAVLPCCTTE